MKVTSGGVRVRAAGAVKLSSVGFVHCCSARPVSACAVSCPRRAVFIRGRPSDAVAAFAGGAVVVESSPTLLIGFLSSSASA